jgi:dTDP-4-dehydrorhamnose 3,5-epimerase-like enzyme
MSKVIIEPLRVARDPRGYLFEPLGASFEGFHNVHVVFTVPGVVRGNHYHVKGTEVCSVSGPTLVRYREGSEIHDVQVPAGEVWRFTFPPGVAHAFRNDGDQPSVLAAFNTEIHDPALSDAVKEVLLDA